MGLSLRWQRRWRFRQDSQWQSNPLPSTAVIVWIHHVTVRRRQRRFPGIQELRVEIESRERRLCASIFLWMAVFAMFERKATQIEFFGALRYGPSKTHHLSRSGRMKYFPRPAPAGPTDSGSNRWKKTNPDRWRWSVTLQVFPA